MIHLQAKVTRNVTFFIWTDRSILVRCSKNVAYCRISFCWTFVELFIVTICIIGYLPIFALIPYCRISFLPPYTGVARAVGGRAIVRMGCQLPVPDCCLSANRVSEWWTACYNAFCECCFAWRWWCVIFALFAACPVFSWIWRSGLLMTVSKKCNIVCLF